MQPFCPLFPGDFYQICGEKTFLTRGATYLKNFLVLRHGYVTIKFLHDSLGLNGQLCSEPFIPLCILYLCGLSMGTPGEQKKISDLDLDLFFSSLPSANKWALQIQIKAATPKLQIDSKFLIYLHIKRNVVFLIALYFRKTNSTCTF